MAASSLPGMLPALPAVCIICDWKIYTRTVERWRYRMWCGTELPTLVAAYCHARTVAIVDSLCVRQWP